MRVFGFLASTTHRILTGGIVLGMTGWAVLAISHSNLPGPAWRTGAAVAFAGDPLVRVQTSRTCEAGPLGSRALLSACLEIGPKS